MCSEPSAIMGDEHGRILLTGATGYVGGRVLRRLEAPEAPRAMPHP